MDQKLTAKQEKFAQLLGTTTSTQSDAYREAYDTGSMSPETIHTEASVLAKYPRVATRIEQIKKENSQHLKYDAEAHFLELEELRVLALSQDKKDITSSIKATELKGKLTGLYVDKSKIEHIGGGFIVEITNGKNQAPPSNP